MLQQAPAVLPSTLPHIQNALSRHELTQPCVLSQTKTATRDLHFGTCMKDIYMSLGDLRLWTLISAGSEKMLSSKPELSLDNSSGTFVAGVVESANRRWY